MFAAEAMLESFFECFLDIPTVMTKIGRWTGWKARPIKKVRHQHTRMTTGYDVAHQTHRLGLAGAIKVHDIALISGPQRDDLLFKSTAKKLAYAREAALARPFDPHAEGNTALTQNTYQPTAGISSIE